MQTIKYDIIAFGKLMNRFNCEVVTHIFQRFAIIFLNFICFYFDNLIFYHSLTSCDILSNDVKSHDFISNVFWLRDVKKFCIKTSMRKVKLRVKHFLRLLKNIISCLDIICINIIRHKVMRYDSSTHVNQIAEVARRAVRNCGKRKISEFHSVAAAN